MLHQLLNLIQIMIVNITWSRLKSSISKIYQHVVNLFSFNSKSLGICGCLLTLSACGFTPVYSKESITYNPLYGIEVAPISTPEGAEFYHYLTTLMPSRGNIKYRLNVSFTYSFSPIAIQKNSDIIRENIIQYIQYKLVDAKTNNVVTGGTFKHMTSYNSSFSPYGSDVEKNFNSTNLTKFSAEEIRRRLILYFTDKKL